MALGRIAKNKDWFSGDADTSLGTRGRREFDDRSDICLVGVSIAW